MTRCAREAHPRSRGENKITAAFLSLSRGSSPLTRGKQRIRPARPRSAGLIPAHAGKTRQSRSPSLPTRAHPRSRGENCFGGLLLSHDCGSSPLTRGKPLANQDSDLHRRAHPRSRGENPSLLPRMRALRGLIPAHAGKTMEWHLGDRDKRAHPRSRGENRFHSLRYSSQAGSSPLTRGKPQAAQARPAWQGLIPAHAGKTDSFLLCAARARAHPRSRGENLIGVAADLSAQGSSPLTRGKPHTVMSTTDSSGLIPAHAGKTYHVSHPCTRTAAHPRSRGENLSGCDEPVNELGSSPLTRGKPGHIARESL